MCFSKSVFVLLMIHLYLFAIIGMLIFPRFYVTNPSNMIRNHPNQKNNTIVTQNKVFGSIKDSLINLLILVTTSNNPDVMIQIYSQSRLAALYFVVYVLIGDFFLKVVYRRLIKFSNYYQFTLTKVFI